MKLSPALPFLLFSCTATAGAADPLFQPHRSSDGIIFKPQRISYLELLNLANDQRNKDNADRDILIEALSTVGMVSIKDIPSYADLREKTLDALPKCLAGPANNGRHAFPDGAVRTTLATRTIPGPGGAQPIPGVQHDDDCRQFENASHQLRSVIDEVTRAFSGKVAAVLGAEDSDDESSSSASPSPALLKTKTGYNFSTFADVVENGEHLEHFHSYTKTTGTATGNKYTDANNSDKTLDFHLDQGLFIAFTPAAGPQGTFYITLEDGSQPEVEFDSNDLIIMLGDGVNQFVNPHQAKLGRELRLRATPHAMRMSSEDAATKAEARTWHGRMVLPPTDAIHHDSSKTYGQLRQLMIDASLSTNEGATEDVLAIGCTGAAAARQLEEATCAEGSTYCWHRCMVHEDHGTSIETCKALGVQLQCINPRGQFSDGDEHGDFFPACSDTTEAATDYPTIPSYPRDMDVCNQAAWEAFADTSGYDYSFDNLGDNQGNRGYWDGINTKGRGKVAKLMWSVTEDEKINAKLVFNGGFGYLAMGFAYPEGKHNGMNGASVIMAIPGGNYSAKFGLDLALDDNVQEYTIDMEGSAFRHWSNPLPNRDTSTYVVNTSDDDCFTSLTFSTDNINDIPFNVNGVDDLVWAGNLKDSFCGSHGRGQEGRGDRDRFMVEWKTGKAWFPAPPEEEEEAAAPEVAADGQETSISSFHGPVHAAVFAITVGVVQFFGDYI